MSRRDFWICIAIIITIFTLGVMVGMCVQVLGVPVHACEEAEEYVSGMPCENPEQFERWYETYEQKTEQETQEEIESSKRGEGVAEESGGLGNTDYIHIQVSNESSAESTAQSNEENEEVLPLYKVDGCLIDPVIQQKLYDALEKHGIAYWFEGALCQMYQESHGQPHVINPTNGEDMGLFQYKNRYWNWSDGDIFDVDAQIERYASDMSARFNSGLSVDEAISRHMTSDFVTEIDWKYVHDVKQWLPTLKKLD